MGWQSLAAASPFFIFQADAVVTGVTLSRHRHADSQLSRSRTQLLSMNVRLAISVAYRYVTGMAPLGKA